MQLEHLCDVEWRTDLIHEVEAAGARDGRIYAHGRATFSGRISGPADWSNFPRLRGDYAHPDACGVIAVRDTGLVFLKVTGLSNLSDGAGIHVMTFETVHEASVWLNDVVAIGEGSVDRVSLKISSVAVGSL